MSGRSFVPPSRPLPVFNIPLGDGVSLPGSDPARLAAIGDAVRARLDAAPQAERAEVVGVDMYFVRDFLSPEECAALIALIDADVKPSVVFRADGDGPPPRTSETCKLPASRPEVAEVEARMIALTGLALDHSETVQGQRYKVGQQFTVHNDYFAAGQPYSARVAAEGGQRTWTAMAFLNVPEAGGRTHFPPLGLEIAPEAGMLLVWNNLDRQGLPNARSHHAGLPVEAGVKYVLTKWFRERLWTPGAADDHRRI
jgi:prolyl 4-hydroxylase